MPYMPAGICAASSGTTYTNPPVPMAYHRIVNNASPPHTPHPTPRTHIRRRPRVTEPGEVNIDEGLVTENLATKEDIVSMDNGCVCCTVRGDLVRTLNSLIARRKDFHAIMVSDPSDPTFYKSLR